MLIPFPPLRLSRLVPLELRTTSISRRLCDRRIFALASPHRCRPLSSAIGFFPGDPVVSYISICIYIFCIHKRRMGVERLSHMLTSSAHHICNIDCPHWPEPLWGRTPCGKTGSCKQHRSEKPKMRGGSWPCSCFPYPPSFTVIHLILSRREPPCPLIGMDLGTPFSQPTYANSACGA